MHSLVMGAAVNPGALTQVRAMRSHCVTTPEALIAATGPTVRNDDRPNPNGVRLYKPGITPRSFERSRAEGRQQPCQLLLGTVQPQQRRSIVTSRHLARPAAARPAH